MVKCLRIKKEFGGKAKDFLKKKGWLNTTKVVGKSAQRYLLFPLTGKFKQKELLKQFPGASIAERSLQKMPARKGTLKDLLKGIVPDKRMDEVIKSYDIIGDIAIIDVPKKLEKLDKSIAWTLKRAYPNLKTVAKKVGKVGDIYRIRKLKVLVGEERTETLHKEFGVAMKLDVAKAYFSPRSSGERMRIAKQVKPNEKVLVMFAGIGPYALMIANVQPKAKIWAVELNPNAYEYLEENLRLNRLSNVIPIKGDVRKEVPKLGEKFDRIIMVLPESGFDFLDVAINAAAKNAVVHFYVFFHEKDLQKGLEKIKQIAKKQKRTVKVLNKLKAGAYGPRIWRWCIDFQVS